VPPTPTSGRSMARRTHDYRLKRDISTRLQQIIDERFESLYGFSQAMEAQKKAALASTVRGWLPPQKLWKAKPNGKAVRRVDWEAVKIPDCSTLIEFCDALSVRADYILLGDGTPSRGQSRAKPELEQDIASHLVEALKADGYEQWSASDVDGAGVLRDAVASAKAEARTHQQKMERLPGRMVAQLGGALDQVWEMSRHLPKTPEATQQLRTLVTTVALLESSLEPDVDDSSSSTRYLASPKFSVYDLTLPEGVIDDRITLSVERVAAWGTLSSDQVETKQAHFRSMLAMLNNPRRKRT
jgi:hypothetical protein